MTAEGAYFPAQHSQDPPQTDGVQARLAAVFLLESVLDRRIALDQALEDSRELSVLPGRDRAFTRMAVATALRRLGQVDDLIRRACEKPENPVPPRLHHLLRVGVAQLAFMNAPDYAVVDTAVRAAEELGLSRQKGFVNALLRRVAREGRDWIMAQDDAALNIPGWLMEIWRADYGPKDAFEIARACLVEAPLDVSAKDQSMLAYWAGTLQAHVLPCGSLRRPSGGMVQDLPGFNDGMWWVQDAAAALPARLFGDIAGKHVIDLCAAPGGKTAQLAAMGAQVAAVERATNRVKRLRENMQRLRLDKHVEIVTADAAAWRPAQKADFVLLDAPCTATGTVRRHPDVLHLKSPRDLDSLMDVQARILANAVNMLAPGGILVYATCSLQKAEGERQIDALLKRERSVQRFPVAPEEIGGIAGIITGQGDVRVLPYHLAALGGMDGFYIARLTKDA